MKYRLICLTHGENHEVLARTLASFADRVQPEPTDRVLIRDEPAGGFCVASGRAWDAAITEGVNYVFWLEHDFIFQRHVDLRTLAEKLEADTQLAQMSLMRTASSVDEMNAGGLYELRKGEYEERGGWLEHRSYFTTTPSLMRRQFMVENRWPTYPSGCEGRFGIDLLARGYTFGVWGDGQPWVEHIGQRTGFGY